jgi:hypothetical protein
LRWHISSGEGKQRCKWRPSSDAAGLDKRLPWCILRLRDSSRPVQSRMLQTGETLNTEDPRCLSLWRGEISRQMTDSFRTARRCTCSHCRIRGAVVVSANLDDMEVVEGQDTLSLHKFGTMTAKHFFAGVVVSLLITSVAPIRSNMDLM